jgi:hypothetical protein
MRGVFKTTLFLFVLLNLPNAVPTAKAQSAGDGLSAGEFRDFAKSLPELPGRIQAIRLFGKAGRQTSSVAVLTWGERSGWQIFVFGSPLGRNFRLDWKSGKLDDTFYVSDPSNLKVFSFMDGKQGVQFSGCAAHNCPNGVFSLLLYVPSMRTAFVAKSVLGKVTYSPSLESAENSEYKKALVQLVKDRASQ